MATRSCPDWPDLLERAPDLHFKHYTADELQLPHDVVLALGDVRLTALTWLPRASLIIWADSIASTPASAI